MDKAKRDALAAERRDHNNRLDALRSEYAPSRDLNAEYQDHQAKIAQIMGEDELPVVGGGCRNA